MWEHGPGLHHGQGQPPGAEVDGAGRGQSPGKLSSYWSILLILTSDWSEGGLGSDMGPDYTDHSDPLPGLPHPAD